MARSYLLVALGSGLVLGLALGGRFHHLGRKTFRWWPLLPASFVLQRLVEADGFPAPFTFLLVGYALLLGFCGANLHHTGMGVVAIGVLLNVVVIAANEGMPVRESAIRAADPSVAGREIEIDEVRHHLETPGSRLMPLADVIPVRPLREVLSFGDLVLAVGVVDLLVHLLRPVHATRWARLPGGRRGRYARRRRSSPRAAPSAAAASPTDATTTNRAGAPNAPAKVPPSA